jgi:hypothetical protein
VTSASANDLSFDTYVCATSGTNAWDAALTNVKQSLTDFYSEAGMSSRADGCSTGFGAPSGQNRGTQADFVTPYGSPSENGHANWVTFSTACGTLVSTLDARIAEIDARIGVPTYSGSAAAVNNPPAIRVSAIPASNTTSGFVPYGRSLYNNCNHLLGQDVDLLGGIIKDVEGLSDLVDMVKTARNKYEIFSGRDKEYS